MFLNSSVLASLRFFEAAARLLSFKQAAVELHVTQGAVSQQIRQLERALGCRLFYRLPRQIILTEEGRKFAAIVANALGEIEEGAQSLAASRSPVCVRVRAGPSFALRWLVPRLGRFYASNPHVSLFITAAYGYLDPIRRDFDVAIELIKDTPASLHCEVLMEEYLEPVCSPEYLVTHNFLKVPGDLSRCTLLHDSHAWSGATNDAEWRYWLDAVGVVDVDCSQGQFFSLANMSIEAARNHQGIAIGRTVLVRDLLSDRQLVSPFQARVKSPATYCILYSKDLCEHPGMCAVTSWLQAEARNDI